MRTGNGRRGRSARALVFPVLFGLIVLATAGPVRADEAAWQALRSGGHALLIRHALAPGTGDPPGFVLEDCATQRNLSDTGRAQARRIGAALREADVRVDRVLSSRWCRALETARLMDVGPVEPAPPLDSFFQNRSDGPARTRAVAAMLAEAGDETLVLVTHQVNITALTGIFPRSGEAIVVRPSADGGLEVVGRLSPGG